MILKNFQIFSISEASASPFSGFWLGSWAAGLSLTWLLPNHFPPWSSFHSDAYVALFFLLAFFAVFGRFKPLSLHFPALLVMALVPLVWSQYILGAISFAGDAWIVTSYLLGLTLALVLGAQWESLKPGQALDGLAIAFGMAGTISVALQLVQWLEIGADWHISDMTGWRMWLVDSSTSRPYANIAQPNNLATLLLLSVLATGWGVLRGKVRGYIAFLLMGYLLFGVALTQSRTAWVAVGMIAAAIWYWRHLWPIRYLPATCSLLALIFAGFSAYLILGVDWITTGGASGLNTERLELGQRPVAWRIFIDALMEKPWFGFGWNQTSAAYLGSAGNYPAQYTNFGHAHNLFLDLMVYCGIPIGLLLSATIVIWCFRMFLRVRTNEDVVALLMIATVGIHAMLELPLHFAYFLFPMGVVAGVLIQRNTASVALQWPKLPVLLLGASSAILLGGIVRDYVGVIEKDHRNMRFETIGISAGVSSEAPDVLLLTQLHELMRLWRFVPRSGLAEADIRWAHDVANRMPGSGTLFKLAHILALNGRPAEAEQWLRRARKVIPKGHWTVFEKAWLELSKESPAIARVAIPPPN